MNPMGMCVEQDRRDRHLVDETATRKEQRSLYATLLEMRATQEEVRCRLGAAMTVLGVPLPPRRECDNGRGNVAEMVLEMLDTMNELDGMVAALCRAVGEPVNG